jgi:hypothetical protein
MKRCSIRGLILTVSLVINAPLASANSRVDTYSPDTLSLRTGLVIPTIPIAIVPPVNSDIVDLKYAQNVAQRAGFGADLGWLGFYLSTHTLNPEFSESTHGLADNFDLQFHFYFPHWALDLYYQDFQGYYLSNTQDVYRGQAPPTNPLIRSDLKAENYGASFFWIFSPEKFSIAASGAGTAKQMKSGGSWMLGPSLGEVRLSSDATIAPSGLESSYGQLGRLAQGRFRTFALGGGYAYNIVPWDRWFVLIWASLLIGPQHQEFQERIGEAMVPRNRWVGSARAVGRFSLGYNGDRFFFAITSVSETTSLAAKTERESLLETESNQSFAYLGFRFRL